MKNLMAVVILSLLFFSSCKKEEVTQGNFTVTIENVSDAKAYFDSGALDAIPSGSNGSFSFHAGRGHYLSFATMLAQTNDLFYGPDANGIALYDVDGNAVTGDVTSQIDLWDAGTEVNMEPGVGSDQAPRQAAPNTGVAENGTVKLITDINDGYTYPSDESVIKVVLAHDGGTMFTVTITNSSNTSSLASPLAPGVWAVHAADAEPIFSLNTAASTGLERLAEDGNNEVLVDDLARESGYVSPFAPGTYAVYTGDNPVFQDGQPASAALEAVAEDGDPSGFAALFADKANISASGVFNTPVSAGAPAPIFPGESYEFSFDAQEGQKLSFATMLIQSNDLFFGPSGIDLFNGETAVSADVTSQVELWDAYTEVNEYPGAGNNQAPRQTGPNTGTSESSNVALVNDAFTYPALSDMIKVTITAN